MSWIDDLIDELPGTPEPLDWSLASELDKLHTSSYSKDLKLIYPDTQEEGLKLLRRLKMNQICNVKENGGYGQTEYARYARKMLGLTIYEYDYL